MEFWLWGASLSLCLLPAVDVNLVYLLKMDDFVLLIPQRLDFNKRIQKVLLNGVSMVHVKVRKTST